MNEIWNIAIYARVSTDKKEQNESISLLNSKSKYMKNQLSE